QLGRVCIAGGKRASFPEALNLVELLDDPARVDLHLPDDRRDLSKLVLCQLIAGRRIVAAVVLQCAHELAVLRNSVSVASICCRRAIMSLSTCAFWAAVACSWAAHSSLFFATTAAW